MQELVGRLTTLDPAASETLKVVSYFDALVSAGAGADALLRSAAALSGTTAGARVRDRVSRRSPDGRRLEGDTPSVRSAVREISVGEVWLERPDAAHANDEMVVERLALAIELVEARRRPEAALETAIDAQRPAAERQAALARLRIEPRAPVRAVAVPLEADEAGSIPVAIAGRMVRAILDDGTRATPPVAGLGTWTTAAHLPESWEAATTSLRLTDIRHPVVDASELGALLLVTRGYDESTPPADVIALSALDDRCRDVLRAIVKTESMRAAAADLGMHHSTVQARHDALTRDLGYDPRSALGRARYLAADLLLRFGQM